jgi:hypothetical protein
MKPKIATANDLTRGQESAVLIKIASLLGYENIHEAVEMFLRGTFEIVVTKIIDIIGIVFVSATTEKFVAKDRFKLKKDGGHFSNFNDNFTSWFLTDEGKVEDSVGEQHLRFGTLLKISVDGPVLEELGGEAKAETTLCAIYDLQLEQPNGEKEGVLLNNGYSNIFYVRDTLGVLRAVCVYWYGGGWGVVAYSVEGTRAWDTDSRVFSANS